MSMLSRTSQVAISAMSHLAEVYDEERFLTATEIARARRLPQAFVAKVLVALSRGGLLAGARGPQGGYRLARPPAKIRLDEIVLPFEREDDTYSCPFGPGYCGHEPVCPLHDHLVALRAQMAAFLGSTTLIAFAPVAGGRRGGAVGAQRGRKKKAKRSAAGRRARPRQAPE